MREQFRRILAAACSLCMLPGIISAPAAGAAVTTETIYAADTQYADSASFSAKVQEILAGECGVYADQYLTVPVSLPLGSALNTWQTYFVNAGYGGWSGMQCYIYAQGVYSVLFGEMAGNGGANDVMNGVWEITPDVLYAHRVMPGAYLRTTANADLSFNGSYGHSMILLSYNDTTITVLEGNANGAGSIELNTLTYDQFNNRFTTGKSRGVCHVIQPDESFYAERYGMYFSGGNGMMPKDSVMPIAVTTQPVTTVTEPATTTSKVTTAKATTTTTTTTTSATRKTTTTTTTTAATTVTTTTAAAVLTVSVPEVTMAADVFEPVESVTSTQPVSENENTIYAEKLDAPVFFPIPNAEQYTWSSSDPEVVFLIWDGIAIAKNNGIAVITAENETEHLEFEICVDAVNWDVLGDVNADGSVDLIDAVVVMNAYVDSTMSMIADDPLALLPPELADVNGSGDVDLVDAQLILQYYVNTTLQQSDLSAKEAWEQLR